MITEFLRVTPHCCEESNKSKLPYLEFIYEDNYHDRGFLKDKKPVWCVKSIGSFGSKYGDETIEFESNIPAKFCPFCGTNVPEIELNPLAKRRKIYNTDSGDYCESCGERSMCCNCIPAPFRWRPVGVDLVLPKMKKQEED